VVAYCTPGPTFGNGRRSYIASYNPSADPHVADVCASRMLRSAGVRAAVEFLLDSNRLGVERRIVALAEIVAGGKQTRKDYNAAGELVRTTVSDLPASDRLKAIDILNKLDGSYDQPSTANSASTDRTAAMIAENLPLLHQPN
jgi:hypothetical protein